MQAPINFEPEFVKNFFNGFAAGYSKTSATALGLDALVRRKAISTLGLRKNMRVADLMSGNGCNWPIIKNIARDAAIIAVDFSQEMNAAARPPGNVTINEECATRTSIPTASVDAVVCTFGLKTMNSAGRALLAEELLRILKPGGSFAVIELSVPQGRYGKLMYKIYFSIVLPAVGLCIKQAGAHPAYLQQYVRAFGNSRMFAGLLQPKTRQLQYLSYLGGFVTGVAGIK